MNIDIFQALAIAFGCGALFATAVIAIWAIGSAKKKGKP